MNYEERYYSLVTDFNGNPLKKDERGNWVDPSFDQMMQAIKDDIPFAFARYGDGEWMAVLDIKKEHQSNADGALYYDSLRATLREVLLSKPPTYKLGLQNFAWRNLPQIEGFLQAYDLTGLNWVTSDALHRANMKRPEKMEEFFEILRNKDVLLVGPEFLSKVDKFKFEHLVIPEKEAWITKDRILAEIEDRWLRYGWEDCFLFACGMTTNYLINEMMKPDLPDWQLIDIGSLLDPYAGIDSRTYHKDVIARL